MSAPAQPTAGPDIEAMPPELREYVQRGTYAHVGAGIVRRGIFPHDDHTAVQNFVGFLESMHQFYEHKIREHPRFAEFWPQAARQLEAERRALEPQILGPLGLPIEKAPAPPEPEPAPEPVHGVDCSYRDGCTVGVLPEIQS